MWLRQQGSETECVFSRDGALVSLRVRRSQADWEQMPIGQMLERRASRDANQERVDVQPVAGLTAWTIDGLHGIRFGTWGASTARTTFSAAGLPEMTVLEDQTGHEIGRARYQADTKGNVVEAIQKPTGAIKLQTEGASDNTTQVLLALPGFSCSATFDYDSEGRVLRVCVDVTGTPIQITDYAYNKEGDVESSTTNRRERVQREYEYDQYGNWVRMMVNSGASSYEERRTIEYYGDNVQHALASEL